MVKGVNDKKTNVGTFKTQVDNLNKKLKTLESDTTMWKEKFDESNEVVVKMNTAASNSGIELEATKRKLAAMEKLNRTLQAERTKLLGEVKSKDQQQNGNH
jgi:chromosome segregation ATPase